MYVAAHSSLSSVIFTSSQSEDVLAKIMRIADRVARLDKEEKPVHVYDKENSHFRILTETEYAAMSVEVVLKILSTKHIVITHRETNGMAFDEEGLRSIRGLRAGVKIQGTSILHVHNPYL